MDEKGPIWIVPKGWTWNDDGWGEVNEEFSPAEHREILMIRTGNYVWWKKRWRVVRRVIWTHPARDGRITVSFIGASSNAVNQRPDDVLIVYTGTRTIPHARPNPKLTGDLV